MEAIHLIWNFLSDPKDLLKSRLINRQWSLSLFSYKRSVSPKVDLLLGRARPDLTEYLQLKYLKEAVNYSLRVPIGTIAETLKIDPYRVLVEMKRTEYFPLLVERGIVCRDFIWICRNITDAKLAVSLLDLTDPQLWSPGMMSNISENGFRQLVIMGMLNRGYPLYELVRTIALSGSTPAFRWLINYSPVTVEMLWELCMREDLTPDIAALIYHRLPDTVQVYEAICRYPYLPKNRKIGLLKSRLEVSLGALAEADLLELILRNTYYYWYNHKELFRIACQYESFELFNDLLSRNWLSELDLIDGLLQATIYAEGIKIIEELRKKIKHNLEETMVHAIMISSGPRIYQLLDLHQYNYYNLLMKICAIGGPIELFEIIRSRHRFQTDEIEAAMRIANNYRHFHLLTLF